MRRMRCRPLWLLLWPGLLLAACDGPQSALDPAGPMVDAMNLVGIVMYVGAAVVTLLVTVLMLVPFVRRRGAASTSACSCGAAGWRFQA